ncbi:hypothetical protein VYU27_000667 [Nannochloropsis oceanica]
MSVHPLLRLADLTENLMRKDARVGYPSAEPEVEPESFGWLFSAQQILLDHVLGDETRVVVQLGAYLGKTTLFIAEHAPRALIFVVDPWDNAVLKTEPSLNKNFANIDLFDRVPFYQTFLRNTWHLAARRRPDEGDRLVGVVPLRMGFDEGLALLKADLSLRPDVLYWEGFPDEAGLLQTLGTVKEAFPGVVVVGDGYNYPEVQAGLTRASKDLYQDRKPFVEMGKCWTYLRLKMGMLSELRAKYTATDNRAERTVLASKEVAGASFKDLLSGLKSKSRQLKDDEAEERAARRRAEEEERDRTHREREAEEEEERQRRWQEGYKGRETPQEGEARKDSAQEEKGGMGCREYHGRRQRGRGRDRGEGRIGWRVWGQDYEGEGRGRHETAGGGGNAVVPKRPRQEMEEDSEHKSQQRWDRNRRHGEVDESEDDEWTSRASGDEEDEGGRGWV